MIHLAQVLYDEVIAHCRSCYPKEACGILAGKDGVVARVHPMRNVEDSPIGYSMDPKEQLSIEKQMRACDQRMLGIYHSHTSSDAYPSPVDVGLASSPDISYVVVSLEHAEPKIKSFRIDGRTVTPEDVRIDQGAKG